MSTQASSIVKWSAVCRFPSTKRWENTVPPTVGTPASVRARYEGHQGGKPIFIIEDLTYLPKLLRTSPRKATSGPSTPTTPSRLFKGKKCLANSDSEGPSTPSPKRLHANKDVFAAEPAPVPALPLPNSDTPIAPSEFAEPPSAPPKRRTSSCHAAT
jgi:hypothetical protein